MTKMTIKLDALTCPSCMTKIQNAVSRELGVQEVKVLFNAGKVKVTADAHVDGAHLAEVIQALGYDVLGVKTAN